MPEKPKRRKNNKNKRNKHKNKTDSNKINNFESTSADSCAASVDVDKQENSVTEGSNPEISLPLTEISIPHDQENINKFSDSIQESTQDLNSNSADLPDLNNIAITQSCEDASDSIPIDLICDQEYVVESPEQSTKSKSKLNSNVKSKSMDNDDLTKIVDITEEINCQVDGENSQNLVKTTFVSVSEVDSDIEWEKTDDLEEDTTITRDLIPESLSSYDIPITITHNEQTRSLTAEEEESLRNCLKKMPFTNPSTDSSEIIIQTVQVLNHGGKPKLRKKASADDFIFHRLGPPRTLDVIDEEGSGESSKSSRRQSYLCEKRNDNDDLDDDVFEDPIKKEKYITKMNKTAFGRQIQQQCMLVDAKLKEPEVSEARGDWSVTNVEKMIGAEVVYLTDTSSSTSSIYENSEEGDECVETDVSVRMITPTIEVTDTETLLKETFMSRNDQPNGKLDTSVIESSEQVINEHNTGSVPTSHEIVVLSTDNIKTNLTVKDAVCVNNGPTEIVNSDDLLTSISDNTRIVEKTGNEYDLEMKVLKCELNDAINNLIKEVSSDSESSETKEKEILYRQDSSSSVESSQCTAKYNPTYSSLNDVANIVHDGMSESSQNTLECNNTGHVKEVFQCVTGIATHTKNGSNIEPSSLRDLCVRKVATFPYGDKILEELASVSKRLQNISIYGRNPNEKISEVVTNKIETQQKDNMPYYPLPDVSCIEKISLSTKEKDKAPPPVQPRKSSLKLSQDENHWVGMPTESVPVYVCLSPSQKMLMEKTNTVITKEDASQLVDMHKKYIDRRGYNEYYDKEQRKEIQRLDNPPVVPFKSQTGSRLLALIRDPAVTDNINSMKIRNQLKILDQIQPIDKKAQTSLYNKNAIHRSANEISNTFKPIPPPRTGKFSSTVYESDESSDFTDSSFRSIRNEKKLFHFSTGNLSKEIENDISSIQNMHRYCSDVRDHFKDQNVAGPRRPSLPKDLCDQQMEYIRKKEKEVEAEISRLENEKMNVPRQEKKSLGITSLSKSKVWDEKITRTSSQSMLLKNDSQLTGSDFKSLKLRDKQDKGKFTVFNSSQEELLRDKMYSEYVNQMAEREERRQQKVIKITNNNNKPVNTSNSIISKSMPALDFLDSKVNNRIEKEFIWKARERWNKLGIKDPETEDERDLSGTDVYREPKVIEHKIKVIEGGEEKDMKKLPSHLQEFVRFTVKDTDQGKSSPAVWRPGAPTPPPAPAQAARSPGAPPPPPLPVWTPGSAGASPQTPRKSFRPVHFEETPPTHRKFGSSDQNGCTSGSESEGRLRTSHSAPATGLNSLGSSSRLPRAQNPTVTLLQKAREGQLTRGSSYLQQERDSARLPRDRASPPKGDPVHELRREYASEGEADRGDYVRAGGPRKMAHAHEKVEGIGPTTKDGMPVALRSEVKDQSKWYKKMYDTIHKNKYDGDYVTIRYKSRRGPQPERVTANKSQYAYFDPRSGYLSEPEGGLSRLGSTTWSDAYDSDITTSPRRRTTSVQEERQLDDDSSPYLPSNKYSTLASAKASHEVYKNQPGRIENYVPGRSSVVDKEAKQWWDEVMDIFDGQISSTTSLPQASPKEKKDITSAILSKSNMARALKESGYESDSTLVFRRRDDTETPLSPAERRAAYRDLQAGGEPPLRGFRSPAPPRTESPRRYVESDVNIHYRCPVRHDPLPLVPERELARQQAEHMKRLYREQRRHKYLQENEIHTYDKEMFDASIKELQDMQSRRHLDNFTPSQKAVVPLNRYDEAERIAARALYAFNGQTQRELSFRKGDLIHVRRQIDSNWYEGELHGKVGLFPYNYVEILKGDVAQSPKKPVVQEGRARAKFDFTAQTNLELPLKKGEVVVLTRRIDQNWWEGRNGAKTGIFPDSYVTILQEPSLSKPEMQASQQADKPAGAPAAHGLLNGAARRGARAHSYTPQPNSPALSNAPPATQPLPGYTTKPAQAPMTPSERGYGPPAGAGVDLNNPEPLYVDTNAEAVPYRAMYKYRPQNPDELELNEGDTVYVLEKCDDGWYVGSSQRSGRFGTFPGNYVERI